MSAAALPRCYLINGSDSLQRTSLSSGGSQSVKETLTELGMLHLLHRHGGAVGGVRSGLEFGKGVVGELDDLAAGSLNDTDIFLFILRGLFFLKLSGLRHGLGDRFLLLGVRSFQRSRFITT